MSARSKAAGVSSSISRSRVDGRMPVGRPLVGEFGSQGRSLLREEDFPCMREPIFEGSRMHRLGAQVEVVECRCRALSGSIGKLPHDRMSGHIGIVGVAYRCKHLRALDLLVPSPVIGAAAPCQQAWALWNAPEAGLDPQDTFPALLSLGVS